MVRVISSLSHVASVNLVFNKVGKIGFTFFNFKGIFLLVCVGGVPHYL